MTAVRINKLRPMVLTRTNVCGIMGLPNIGKEHAMEHETKEEVLDRVFTKLSKLTDDQLERFVRLAREQGIELDEKEGAVALSPSPPKKKRTVLYRKVLNGSLLSCII